MKNWKVYCYTGQNDKKYVGITCRTIKKRAGKDGYCYTQHDCKFARAIKKYGFDFFTVETLAEGLSKEEANELEKYYIKKYDSYKNGYNDTLGGDGLVTIDYDKIIDLWDEGKSVREIREELNCGRKIIATAFDGAGIAGKERIDRGIKKHHSRAVYQYDLDGNYLNTFNSVAEASEKLKINSANIFSCLKGERKSAGEFQWSIELKDNIGKVQRKEGNHKEVYQYSLNKELIAIHHSAAGAARNCGYKWAEYIRRKAREQGIAYGYIWSYEPLD